MKRKIIVVLILSMFLLTSLPNVFAEERNNTQCQMNENQSINNTIADRNVRIFHIPLLKKDVFMVLQPMIFVNGLVQWDFGDQAGKFGRNIVIHEYNTPGTYTVSVSYTTILDNDCTGSRTFNI